MIRYCMPSFVDEIYSPVVRASDYQCQSRNIPGSIPASSDTIRGAADEAVLKKEH